MKYNILLVVLFSPSLFFGQSKEYNTKIGKAMRVEVNAGTTNILRADTVIIQIFSGGDEKTKLFLTKYNQTKDSAGIYSTELIFGNPFLVEYHDVDFVLQFSEPIIDIDCGAAGTSEMIDEKLSNDKTGYHYTVIRAATRMGIHVLIKSKTPIRIKVVKGIFGVLG